MRWRAQWGVTEGLLAWAASFALLVAFWLGSTFSVPCVVADAAVAVAGGVAHRPLERAGGWRALEIVAAPFALAAPISYCAGLDSLHDSITRPLRFLYRNDAFDIRVGLALSVAAGILLWIIANAVTRCRDGSPLRFLRGVALACACVLGVVATHAAVRSRRLPSASEWVAAQPVVAEIPPADRRPPRTDTYDELARRLTFLRYIGSSGLLASCALAGCVERVSATRGGVSSTAARRGLGSVGREPDRVDVERAEPQTGAAADGDAEGGTRHEDRHQGASREDAALAEDGFDGLHARARRLLARFRALGGGLREGA